MKIKNFLRIFAAVLSVSMLLTGCANTSKEPGTVTGKDGKELKVLRVAHMTGNPSQHAAYIGTQQGIYEKYGIALEETEFAWGINTVDSILTGTADIGNLADFAAVNRFGNTLAHNTLVIFSDQAQGTTAKLGGIYVAPKYANDLASLDGSEGWITSIGTVTEYYNWQAQTYLGLDPDKQKAVNTDSISTSIAAAHGGNASAVVATGSQGEKYENEGWVKAAELSDVGISVSDYLITTREFGEKNTELLANYLKALSESVDYINAHLDESAEKISAKFGIEADTFKQEWQQRVLKYGLTEENASHLDSINNWAFDHGKFPESYNVRQFYFDGAAKLAFPENVTADLSSVN